MPTQTSLYAPTGSEIEPIAQAMVAANPGDAARIVRAAGLVAAGAVDYTPNGWAVASQRLAGVDPDDPEVPAFTSYTVTATTCQCTDHTIRSLASQRVAGVAASGCKHILAVSIYLKVISAKLDAELQQTCSDLYAIETATPDLYMVMDEAGVVCNALYNRRSGKYRPETGQDAADFARWLGGQPQMFDNSGTMLERILRNCPADVPSVTLKVRVIYGSQRQYTLTGYLYEGQTWVKLALEDQQRFNQSGWNATLAATGWIQPGRPVKADGLMYRYTLVRGTEAEEHHGLTAGTDDYRREQRLLNLFTANVTANAQRSGRNGAFADVEEMEAQYEGLD